jgi:hypothetical protein
MNIEIQRTANGFLVSYHDNDDGSGLWSFEEPDNAPLSPDPDTTARMLWQVIEVLGASGNRHDAKRVRVVVEPGDKYEGKK